MSDSPTTAARCILLLLWAVSLVVTTKACTPGQASTSGIIQLTGSSCLPSSRLIDRNELQAVCGAAFKVDVNSKGYIYMTPLEQGTFKWAGPGPYRLPSPGNSNSFNWGNFQCKDMNATGLFDATNKKVAATMSYNDVGRPPSRLVVTGANKLTLVANNTMGYEDPGPNCTHNFTVVSGCVMGIQPSKVPYSCPSGWYIKTNTKNKIKYCAPCPMGSSSAGPGATKCTPCPAGYEGRAGGKCTKCQGSSYSSEPGTPQCDVCYLSVWQNGMSKPPKSSYSDGKSCKPCPADSWSYESNPRQCVACNNGVRCCRTNPSADCPACPAGFKSGATVKSATFALTSASPAACLKIDSAVCTTNFTVNIKPSCELELQVYAPSADSPCYNILSTYTSNILKKKASIYDVPLFKYIHGTASLSSIQGPFVTYKLQASSDSSTVPKTCLLTYRSITSAGALLGITPAPCPAGSPGCMPAATKKCPAGSYVRRNIDGNTLCLPCPPGTYTIAANTATQCSKCPAGKYASGYGSIGCSTCPVGTFSKKGSPRCIECSNYSPQGDSGDGSNSAGGRGYYSSKPGSSNCLPCPANSISQGGPGYPIRVTKCLGQSKGMLCCAAGDCTGQPACPAKLQPHIPAPISAILQLQSVQLSHPTCQNATFAKCLSPNGQVVVKSTFQYITIYSYQQPGCLVTYDYGYTDEPNLYGEYSATNRVSFQSYSRHGTDTYEFVSDASTGTVKMYYVPGDRTSSPLNPSTVKCSATFKITSGYAFDLKPPKGAKCPAGSAATMKHGVAFCLVCDRGFVVKQGACSVCPAGSYQPLTGGGRCITCPVGTFSTYGSSACGTCWSGSVPSSNRKTCNSCPANTYALPHMLKCKACPAGLVAPASSGYCGVPFPKK